MYIHCYYLELGKYVLLKERFLYISKGFSTRDGWGADVNIQRAMVWYKFIFKLKLGSILFQSQQGDCYTGRIWISATFNPPFTDLLYKIKQTNKKDLNL